MGREVRMVPADWQHPRYPDDHYESHLRGRYIPLFDGGFATADSDWSEERAKWVEGFVRNYGEGGQWRPRKDEEGPRYTDYAGPRPSPDDYMPEWPEGQARHLMMYEDTSEGTPISPAFATAEELARWLADTGASAFADMTATYEQWLDTIGRGFAVSAVLSGGEMRSGVEAMAVPEESALRASPQTPPNSDVGQPNSPPKAR